MRNVISDGVSNVLGFKSKTDNEYYEYIKELHKKDPALHMNPEVWKKKRLEYLKEDQSDLK